MNVLTVMVAIIILILIRDFIGWITDKIKSLLFK